MLFEDQIRPYEAKSSIVYVGNTEEVVRLRKNTSLDVISMAGMDESSLLPGNSFDLVGSDQLAEPASLVYMDAPALSPGNPFAQTKVTSKLYEVPPKTRETFREDGRTGR